MATRADSSSDSDERERLPRAEVDRTVTPLTSAEIRRCMAEDALLENVQSDEVKVFFCLFAATFLSNPTHQRPF